MRKVEPTAQHACRKITFEHKAGPQLPHAAGVTTGQPPPRTMALPAGWPNRNTWTRRISAPAAAATAVDQMDAAQEVLRQKCGDRGPGRSSAAHTLCPPTGGGVGHYSRHREGAFDVRDRRGGRRCRWSARAFRGYESAFPSWWSSSHANAAATASSSVSSSCMPMRTSELNWSTQDWANSTLPPWLSERLGTRWSP